MAVELTAKRDFSRLLIPLLPRGIRLTERTAKHKAFAPCNEGRLITNPPPADFLPFTFGRVILLPPPLFPTLPEVFLGFLALRGDSPFPPPSLPDPLGGPFSPNFAPYISSLD